MNATDLMRPSGIVIPNGSPELGVGKAILQAAKATLMVGLGGSRLESAVDDSSIKSSPSTRKRDNRVQNAIPPLAVVKAAVTGLGMAPGLEAAVSGTLEVLQMYEVCSQCFSPHLLVLT